MAEERASVQKLNNDISFIMYSLSCSQPHSVFLCLGLVDITCSAERGEWDRSYCQFLDWEDRERCFCVRAYYNLSLFNQAGEHTAAEQLLYTCQHVCSDNAELFSDLISVNALIER